MDVLRDPTHIGMFEPQDLDILQGVFSRLTAVQTLERGAKLYSRPVDGTPCRFRTAYDVNLVPLQLESAALESPVGFGN